MDRRREHQADVAEPRAVRGRGPGQHVPRPGSRRHRRFRGLIDQRRASGDHFFRPAEPHTCRLPPPLRSRPRRPGRESRSPGHEPDRGVRRPGRGRQAARDLPATRAAAASNADARGFERPADRAAPTRLSGSRSAAAAAARTRHSRGLERAGTSGASSGRCVPERSMERSSCRRASGSTTPRSPSGSPSGRDSRSRPTARSGSSRGRSSRTGSTSSRSVEPAHVTSTASSGARRPASCRWRSSRSSSSRSISRPPAGSGSRSLRT